MKRPYASALGLVLAIFIAGTVCGFAWFRLTHTDPHDPLLEKCLAVSEMKRQMFVCYRTPGCDHQKMRGLAVTAIRVWLPAKHSAVDSGRISPAAWNRIQSLDQQSDVDDLKSDVDDLKSKVDDLEGEIDSIKNR